MHLKHIHRLAPLEWNVHLKVFVLFVLAIWHIAIRFLCVVLFVMNSKLRLFRI